MTSNKLKLALIFSILIYFIVSILGFYHEQFNSLLFVLSFLVFAILIFKILLSKGSLHLFRYIFARTSFHLKKKNPQRKFDGLYEHYQNIASCHASSFWILISLMIFIETIIIAFLYAH